MAVPANLREKIGIILGPALFVTLLLAPFPNLAPAAQKLSAVCGLTIVFWICEPIPLAVTALLGPALCVVLGVAEAKVVLAAFGDPTVFVFLGSFLLAQAMMAHGLDRRLALTLLGARWVGQSTRRIMLALGGTACFLSMWLSNTATTAMLMPIGLGVLGEMALLSQRRTGKPFELRGSRIGSGLMIMIAFAASVGGVGTPIGTPPNLIGVAMIRQLLGVNIAFFTWMEFAVPMMLLMFGVLYLCIVWLNPPEMAQLPGLADYLAARRREQGPWTRGQVNALLAFGVAVTLWMTPGLLSLVWGEAGAPTKAFQKHVPEGIAALLAASLLFVLPIDWKAQKFTLTWAEAVKIDWGTILLFGGGIALGGLMFSTGLAEALGKWLVGRTGVGSLWGVTTLSIAIAIVISETSSNTASANMAIPLAISMARSLGIDPLLPALGACLGASFGFMLPVSTPPNAIVYGTGLIPITRMVRVGVVFDIVGLGMILAGLTLAKMLL